MLHNTVTVDGCDYTSEHELDGLVESILVKDDIGNVVGEAIIDHNLEHIAVNYYDVMGDIEDETTFPYYEYTFNEHALHNMVAWLVSTHPEV